MRIARFQRDKVDFRSVFELAQSGDQVAREIRDYCIEVWSAAAVGLIHAYDPELIVIGGGVMRSADVILPAVQNYVNLHAWTAWGKVKVVDAQLGNHAGLFGAAPSGWRCVMRFCRSKHLFTLNLLLVVLGLSAAALAEWQPVGNVKPLGRNGNQFTFGNDRTTVVITVLAPSLVRVRAVQGRTLPADHSYAVVKTDWPAVQVQSSSRAAVQSIRTSQLEVRVELSPFRVAFYDAQGKLLSKDADNLGLAWDGARVREWKWAPPDEHYFGFGEKSTPLDKRGRSLVMWNKDPEGFDASSEPLYQSVPFFIALRQGRSYGIFFDNTYRSSFDMASSFPTPIRSARRAAR